MKHGVSTYSYDRELSSGRMTLPDVIRRAGELGFDGVELAGAPPSAVDPGLLRQAARAAGVDVCSAVVSADFSRDVPGRLAQLRREIDGAQALGARVLRTDIYGCEPPDPYDARVMDALRQAAEYAGERGVCLITENHGGYFCLSDRMETLVRRVGHGNFALLSDIGNYLDAGEDPARALSRLGGMTRHVHLKDAHLKDGGGLYPGPGWYMNRRGDYWRCAITGQGSAPVMQCLKVLDGMGYEGYLIQEFEGLEDSDYAVAQGLDFTRRALAALKHFQWNEET